LQAWNFDLTDATLLQSFVKPQTLQQNSYTVLSLQKHRMPAINEEIL